MKRLAGLLVVLLVLPVVLAQEGHVHTDRKAAKVLPLPQEKGVFHFLIFGDRTGGPREGLKVLAQGVEDANLLDPDLVMTVGDLVGGYGERAEWVAEMEEYKAIMKGLRMPWFPVAGNHDVYWGNAWKPAESTPKGQHESTYEEHFGPLWYWFPHKNAAFVVLFTDEGDEATNRKGYGEPELVRFSDAQLAFVTKTLKETKDYDHVFFFMHHPRWIADFYPGTNWEKVHQLCVAAGNVTAVFGGHIHRQRYEGRRDGIEYMTLSVTGGGIPFDKPGTGYLHHMNLVSVRKDRISVSTLPVGAVLDPKEMTPAHLADIGKARKLPVTSTSAPPVVKPDGSAEGRAAWSIVNPLTRPIEVTVTAAAGGGDWRIRPGHLHFVLEPGKSREFTIGFHRSADDFKGEFSIPRLGVVVDYLAPGRRVSLPEMAHRVALSPEGLRAGPAPEDGNRAVALDGTGASYTVPSSSLKLPQGPVTVEAWFNAAKVDGNRAIVGKTEQSEFTLQLYDGVPVFLFGIGKPYVIAEGKEDHAVKPGTRHHLAGVYDGAEVRVYLDGKLVGSEPGTGPRILNGFPLFVGAEPSAVGEPNFVFEGSIDEVRISKKARYGKEAFTPAKRHEPDADTVLLLHLDRARGPFTPDASSNLSHATKMGEPKLEKTAIGTR